MTPIFGINITSNKKNEEINGQEFIVASTAQDSMKELEDSQNELQELVKSSRLPLWLMITRYSCWALGLMTLIPFVKVGIDNGFAETYKNAPWLIWSGAIALVAAIIISIYEKKKQKSVLETKTADFAVADVENNLKAVYENLGIPSDAANVDVIMFRYKEKNGAIIPKAVGLSPEYVNIDCKMFARDGSLFVADTQNLYEFPIEQIKGIKEINKRIALPFWNKDIPFNEGVYKQYKLVTNNMNFLLVKPYYILEIERDGKPFGLYFPCYELPIVERLTK